MEGYTKTGEVEGGADDLYIMLHVIAMYAKFREILLAHDLTFDHGVVMVLDEQIDCYAFLDHLKRVDCIVEQRDLNRKNVVEGNDVAVCHIFHKYDKREAIYDFLEAEDFLPILIACGMEPEVDVRVYKIWLEKDVCENAEELSGLIEILADYVEQNYDVIKHELELFKSSEFVNAGMRAGESRFWIGLMATIRLYYTFFRSNHEETEADDLLRRYRDAVEVVIRKSAEKLDSTDVMDAVRMLVFRFVEDREGICVGDCRQIEGEVLNALTTSLAILYDDGFYFWPEKLLKEACKPILSMMSFASIKMQLKEAGVLYANDTHTVNFTTKLCLVTAFGQCLRERFIKISREYLTTNEGLGLENLTKKKGGSIQWLLES